MITVGQNLLFAIRNPVTHINVEKVYEINVLCFGAKLNCSPSLKAAILIQTCSSRDLSRVHVIMCHYLRNPALHIWNGLLTSGGAAPSFPLMLDVGSPRGLSRFASSTAFFWGTGRSTLLLWLYTLVLHFFYQELVQFFSYNSLFLTTR